MLNHIKANILFKSLLKRPDISLAYKMVPPTDSWYETIKKVHESLEEIQKLPHEILEVMSFDNLTLKGIYYPNNSDVTVICAHGYTSHAEREWAFPGLFYLSLGYNVLIPYQRGHGLSEGKYTSFGGVETLDMKMWVSLINSLFPNGKIIIHGLSMGGGIVLNLSKHKLDNVKCLIADAPNVSIREVFKNISNKVFKRKGDKISAIINKKYKKIFKHDVDEFESIECVKESKYPILLSAGSNEHLEEIFDIIKHANPFETSVIILPGCNHGNGMYKQKELYQNSIVQFLNKHL